MKRYHCRYADVFPAEYGTYYAVDEVDARIATLEAELARAKELAVWAVMNFAFISRLGDLCAGPDRAQKYFDCDGTPAGILAALEKAKGDKP